MSKTLIIKVGMGGFAKNGVGIPVTRFGLVEGGQFLSPW
jgi:hypothetical protein